MIKTLLGGLWVCAVALGSAYAAVIVGGAAAGHGADAAPETGDVEYVKSESLSVPVIRHGRVEGYVVSQMSFAVAKPKDGAEVTPYLVDAAFRALYESAPLDFTGLKAEDLTSVTAKAKAYANARLGGDVVKDVLIAELNYVARDEVRTNWAKAKH
jgi:hypothetical protein